MGASIENCVIADFEGIRRLVVDGDVRYRPLGAVRFLGPVWSFLGFLNPTGRLNGLN